LNSALRFVQDVALNGIAIGKAILAHKYCDVVGISPHRGAPYRPNFNAQKM
jgi:hypothetical protein